jgi:thioredoxin-related protein
MLPGLNTRFSRQKEKNWLYLGGGMENTYSKQSVPELPLFKNSYITIMKGAKSLQSILLLFIILFWNLNSIAQAGKIPPFSMMQANGKVFKAQDLPLGKPIIVIYFDPDCDHCEKTTKELLKKMDEFKKASIAMVTYLAVDKVVEFEKKHGLKKYPNIFVGTEGSTYFLKNYYRLTTMPYIALYTKNGDFVKEYRTEGPLTDLSSQLKNL